MERGRLQLIVMMQVTRESKENKRKKVTPKEEELTKEVEVEKRQRDCLSMLQMWETRS